MKSMVKIEITKNEGDQRLDRFLKKYLKNAPLSHIYKMIRKDIKVNGRRGKIDQMLQEGDELALYVSPDQIDSYRKSQKPKQMKRQFAIAYEDDTVLIVDKPFGLLTHGDAVEKKNTLVNQVCGYLQEKGEYDPGRERVFVPSPVNRLDRNTTGLVIFGKTSASLQSLNRLIRERNQISKYYLTIAAGTMHDPISLVDRMEKDKRKNIVKVIPEDTGSGKLMETVARPIQSNKGYTLVEVELVTGRTHQIRVHLAQAGFPIIGDSKYGSKRVNQKVKDAFHLNTQLLHAYKLTFHNVPTELQGLAGKTVTADLPKEFHRIKSQLFD